VRWQLGVPRGPGRAVTPAAAAVAHVNLLKDPQNLFPGSAATSLCRRLLRGGTNPGEICLAATAAQTGAKTTLCLGS